MSSDAVCVVETAGKCLPEASHFRSKKEMTISIIHNQTAKS